jgi:hypothetical protein
VGKKNADGGAGSELVERSPLVVHEVSSSSDSTKVPLATTILIMGSYVAYVSARQHLDEFCNY